LLPPLPLSPSLPEVSEALISGGTPKAADLLTLPVLIGCGVGLLLAIALVISALPYGVCKCSRCSPSKRVSRPSKRASRRRATLIPPEVGVGNPAMPETSVIEIEVGRQQRPPPPPPPPGGALGYPPPPPDANGYEGYGEPPTYGAATATSI